VSQQAQPRRVARPRPRPLREPIVQQEPSVIMQTFVPFDQFHVRLPARAPPRILPSHQDPVRHAPSEGWNACSSVQLSKSLVPHRLDETVYRSGVRCVWRTLHTRFEGVEWVADDEL
jgi:hypothetical protein